MGAREVVVELPVTELERDKREHGDCRVTVFVHCSGVSGSFGVCVFVWSVWRSISSMCVCVFVWSWSYGDWEFRRSMCLSSHGAVQEGRGRPGRGRLGRGVLEVKSREEIVCESSLGSRK